VEIAATDAVRLDTTDFTLPLSIADHGGGIGKVVVRVNGVVVDESETKGPTVPRDARGRYSESRPLTLSQGENVIVATSYNMAGLVESLPATLTIQVDDPMLRPPSLYVLAVGVSTYRDSSLKLNYAASDAKAIAALFETQGKKALYQDVQVKSLIEEGATLAGIRQAFQDLAGKVKANDVFILYLSGHGVARDGSYHFIPQDMVYENLDSLATNGLGQEELKKLLTSIKAQKSLILLDTCAAGSAVQLASRSLEDKEAVARLMRATGRAVIAASTGERPALEGYAKHGVFTYALLEGLKGAADTAKRDGRITVDELNNYVWECVPRLTRARWGYEQLPMRDIQGQPFPVLQGIAVSGSPSGDIDCKLEKGRR
jgi:hypothetical protein